MARESVFSSLHGELSTRKSAPKVNRPWLAFIFASDFYRLLYFWRNLFFSRFLDDDEARRSAVDGADFREKSDQRSPSEVKRMNIYRPRCIKPVLCMYRKRNCFLRDRQPLPGNSFDFHDCRTLPFPRLLFRQEQRSRNATSVSPPKNQPLLVVHDRSGKIQTRFKDEL